MIFSKRPSVAQRDLLNLKDLVNLASSLKTKTPFQKELITLKSALKKHWKYIKRKK